MPEHGAPAQDGLRERKRAATQAAIERAAIDLALEHGYEHVTVDMICEAEVVSQRTFFNYFGSKEGVIIGTGPAEPAAEHIDAFTRKRGSGEHDPDVLLLRARRQIVRRRPEPMDAELAELPTWRTASSRSS